MANTPEYSLYYPVTGTLVKPGSTDFAAMQASVESALNTVKQQASWFKGALPSNTNLNTWLEVGARSTENAAITGTILNRPPGFNQPFTVETIQRSVLNGIYRQTATMKTTGVFDSVEMYRDSLMVGGVVTFGGEWIPSNPRAGRDKTLIALFGDSQTEAAAGTSWPEYANPLLTGSTLVNLARSGDDTNSILIRSGAKVVSFQVTGGSIPASGTVALTTSERLELRENRAIVGGTIAGVSGTLTHTTGDNWTFTRTTAGTAVSATGWQAFTTGITTAAATVLFWMGGNDFNQGVKGQERTIADHVLGAYRQAVEWGRNTGRRVLVAGVTNRLTALAGSEEFAQAQYINRTLRAECPDAFLDVQAYYVERAIYDMGLTPTAAELAGMARGEIPVRLFIDDVHVSAAAHKALAEKWLAPWLAAKGMAPTGTTLPALPALKPADQITSPTETGWRNVSEWLPAGCVGTLLVNRVGQEVRASLELTAIPAVTTVAETSIPSGFRSMNTRLSYMLVNYGDAVPLGAFALNGTRITIYDPLTKPAGTIGMNFSWYTKDAWPAIYPGTPA